jgi:NAD(P)-dependent dehydrogenase (short-subunit alcohol dehydrogenase family)
LGEIDSIDRAVTTIATRYGRLDVLVNNAGVFAHPEDLSLSSLDIATLDQIIRSNLTGPIWITRACLPMLIKCTGRVVNVTSDMARYDTADGTYLAYRITKAGLDAFTANLAMQVRDTGTLVNGVDPGWVRTEMGGRDAPDSPEDAANLVVWAATLPAGALSGVVFCSEKNAPPTPVRTIPIIPVASES